jgi:hypothetical protein
MELAIRDLKMGEATAVIDYKGSDPYQMIQVHDYLNVSFFRMDPAVRKASRTTIEVFSMAYPELLSKKYFVNVPAIMGWVFTALRFLSKATTNKFLALTYGSQLVNELGFADQIPEAYGGKGAALASQGVTPSLVDTTPEPAKEAAVEKPAETPAEKPAEKAADTQPVVAANGTEKTDKETPAPPTEEKPSEAAKPAEAPAQNGTAPAVEEPAKTTMAEAPAAK